jgi:hypothetical protein
MNYRLAYALGFHPWEDLAEHPPFADELLELMGDTDIEVANTQPDPIARLFMFDESFYRLRRAARSG